MPVPQGSSLNRLLDNVDTGVLGLARQHQEGRVSVDDTSVSTSEFTVPVPQGSSLNGQLDQTSVNLDKVVVLQGSSLNKNESESGIQTDFHTRERTVVVLQGSFSNTDDERLPTVFLAVVVLQGSFSNHALTGEYARSHA